MNVTGATICIECPERNMCPEATVDPWDCPKGKFCPPGTGLDPKLCPTGRSVLIKWETYNRKFFCSCDFYLLLSLSSGTYGATKSLKEKIECTPCKPGYYCPVMGLTAPTNLCDPGYYCSSGVDVSNPGSTINKGSGGLCFEGHYCPKGTDKPIPCNPGYYMPSKGISLQNHSS